MLASRALNIWLVLLVAYGAFALVGIIGLTKGPQIGVNVDFAGDQPVIAQVFPGGSAWEASLRPGDILLEIDGAAVTEESWRRSRDNGESFKAQIGSGQLITAHNSAGREFGRIGQAGLITLSALFLLASALVAIRANFDPTNFRFAVMALIGADALVVAPSAIDLRTSALILEAHALHWVPVAFISFFLVFGRTQSDSFGKMQGTSLRLLFGIALALDFLWLMTYTMAPGLSSWSRLADLMFLGGGLLAGLFAGILNYQRANAQREREMLRIVLVGAFLAVAPFLLLGVFPFVLAGFKGIQPGAAVFGAILIPVSFIFALFRTELMSFRKLVHRGVAYAVVTAAVIVAYGLAAIALRSALGADSEINEPAQIGLFLMFSAGAPLVPGIRNGAYALVDRTLFRGPPNYSMIIRELTEEAAASVESNQLVSRTLSGLKTGLGLQYAAFVRLNQLGAEIQDQVGVADQVQSAAVMELIKAGGTSNSAAQAIALPGGATVLACPIYSRDRFCGSLVLGPRESEEPFSRPDIELLSSVGHLAGTAINRVELVDELRRLAADLEQTNARLVNLRDNERAELSSYLHDAPLQRVALVLAEARSSGLKADLVGALETAVNELRAVSTSLSPSIVENLGLVRALDELCREHGRLSGMKVAFSYGGIAKDARLSPDVELAMYRIAQEALTNCRKHSNADHAWVTMEVLPESVVLSVDDDGRGMPEGLRATTGLGISSMRARAAQLGGELTIGSLASRGTTIVVNLPLPDASGGNSVA